MNGCVFVKIKRFLMSVGRVYQGTLYGTKVAVKILNQNSSLAEAQYEIGLMSEINHPNILKFLGTCQSSEIGQCIILEYIDGGIFRLINFHCKRTKAD